MKWGVKAHDYFKGNGYRHRLFLQNEILKSLPQFSGNFG